MLSFDPSFTRAHLSLSSLAATVPVGVSVLVDRPTDSYGGLVEVAAVAYFLPDRPLRVFVDAVRLEHSPTRMPGPSPVDSTS